MESESESKRKDSDYMVYKFAAAEYHETRARLLQIHCMQIRGDVGGAHTVFRARFWCDLCCGRQILLSDYANEFTPRPLHNKNWAP